MVGELYTSNWFKISFLNERIGFIFGSDGILVNTFDSGSSWTSSVGSTFLNLNSICMINDSIGYASGQSASFSAIIKTENKAKSWDILRVFRSDTLILIESLDFYNKLIGIVVGYKPFLSGYLARTVDGGKNWSEISSNIFSQITEAKIFSDSTFIISADDNVFYTSNSGINWIQTTVGSNAKFDFLTDSIGYLINEYGAVFKTLNQGRSWDYINFAPGSGYFIGLNIINENILYAGSLYKVCKSTDGGTSWFTKQSPLGVNGIITDICFVDSSTGWITTNIGYIYKTTDSGDNWEYQSSNSSSFLSQVKMDDKNDGWIIGKNGLVLNTQNGGNITSADQKLEESIIDNYYLFQNYPNPFNPSTKITYSVASLGSVTLKIYDVLGREVLTLVNEEKPAGRYEVNFNAGHLASGVYFYQIKAGDFIQTKKMLLIK